MAVYTENGPQFQRAYSILKLMSFQLKYSMLQFCVDSKVSSGSKSGCKINAEFVCLWVFRALSIKQIFFTYLYRSASECSPGRQTLSLIHDDSLIFWHTALWLYHLLGYVKNKRRNWECTFSHFEVLFMYIPTWEVSLFTPPLLFGRSKEKERMTFHPSAVIFSVEGNEI